jgi:putative peptidoglycan lipid II flippase
MGLFNAESYKKGTFISIIINILGKGIQFINIFLVSYLFGATKATDLYYYLLNFITVVIAGFISGIDISVLIPEAMRLRELVGERQSKAFINKYLYIYCLLGLLSFSAVFFFPVTILSYVSQFQVSFLSQNIMQIMWAAVLMIFLLACNLLSTVLASYKFFSIPSLMAFFNNFLSLVFLIAFHKKIGITGALMGMTIGYILNFVLLLGVMKRKLNWQFNVVDLKVNGKIIKYIFSSQIVAFM